MATGDSNLNPVVFEMNVPLSDVQGIAVTDNLNGTWSVYQVDPIYFIEIYLDFVEAQIRQMQQEGLVAQDIRGFSAELFVNFRYGVDIPEWGLDETATHGYRFSLSTEVYSMVVTGMPTISGEVDLSRSLSPPTFPMVVVYVLFVLLGVYGLLKGVKELRAHPNQRYQMVLDIVNKYSNEIVVTDKPLSLLSYINVPVTDFDSILRLAINLNKNIMCYFDNEYAEFAAIVDGYAYNYRVEHTDVVNYDGEAVK